MNMKNKCLYCYKPVEKDTGFHAKCAKAFFGSEKAPQIPYSLDQMDELAKKVVNRSVAVPGVQPKLSLSLVKAAKEKADSRLTVVDAMGGQFVFKPPTDRFPEMPENERKLYKQTSKSRKRKTYKRV